MPFRTKNKGVVIMSRQNETENFVKSVDFTDLLSKMQVGEPKIDPLYEKAFLDRNEKPASDYNQNTTTWD